MFLLNKLLPVLFLPLGVVIVLLLYAVIRIRRWPVFVALVILYLASIPAIGDRFVGSLESRYPAIPINQAEDADAIVVLGGIFGPPAAEGMLPNVSESGERLEAGIILAQLGKAPWLVFTGGRLPWENRPRLEGEDSKAQAIIRGVPAKKILVTHEVANTADEARAIADLMREHDWHRVILVTTAWHMPRAVLLFKRAGVDCVIFPVDFRTESERRVTPLSFVPKVEALHNTETALREYYGYWFYVSTGKLGFKK
jgi:uncharacterized SAM-binding protein YcdF (DUF218 family)